jgi:hypothetical protein
MSRGTLIDETKSLLCYPFVIMREIAHTVAVHVASVAQVLVEVANVKAVGKVEAAAPYPLLHGAVWIGVGIF